ncbi:thioesterase family protein [Mechercharimyces sp. CAU 1602]|uniref:thioesterase family protein n=1 Tax=Mechercharimyces sp. CAU 1602 TaxID=2973933 RepID=UPI002161D96B|nr:thioesterase [Mechercharimyces sp. CAU 1602]MCS1351720.1 thioesterase [Mechercharimyces sp. CAU 1602]
MKPGLIPGIRKEKTITVKEEMVASFGGVKVHPALSTVTMVYYMEWVGREIILPYLEEHEEGIGAKIQVVHHAPAPIGKEVTFVAEAVEVKKRQVICRIEAHHDRAVVGSAHFTQAILPKEEIKVRIQEMN